MRSLYQFPFCPFSRKVRIALAEKRLEFKVENIGYLERAQKLEGLNPALEVPVLNDNGTIICDSRAIVEYLEEHYKAFPLLSTDPKINAEIRRIMSWFDIKFYNEVVNYFIREKIIKFYLNKGTPDINFLRIAQANLVAHFNYLSSLLIDQKWLVGGDTITLADITAASQISLLDYLDIIDWQQYPLIKEWYVLIKSRPSFRNFLSERIIGFIPSLTYAELDF